MESTKSHIARDQIDDDIKKTMDIFRKMHSKGPGFAFRFELDGEGRIKNMIWTTGRSRRQYACFGDVVVFDTTYTTNLYKMPFGLFVGVNNHFQTVIYAGILMKEETIEGFDWAYTVCVIDGWQTPCNNADRSVPSNGGVDCQDFAHHNTSLVQVARIP